MPIQSSSRPFLGYGLGLRKDYYEIILAEKPPIDWFEILSENYLVAGGKPLYFLDKVRADYPLVMHGVSLSIGSTEPLDKNYLRSLDQLIKRVQPVWISDHLCWARHQGHNLHDLMPLPYDEETLRHVVGRIREVQDFLGRQILLENVSSYVTYQNSVMSEWEFFSRIVEEADCLMLLDINNVYVSAVNHGFDPKTYLDYVPAQRVWQFHLAGHTDYGNFIIDTHDHPVIDPVWELYRYAVQKFGSVSAMIERDDRMPPFAELMQEFYQMRAIAEAATLKSVA